MFARYIKLGVGLLCFFSSSVLAAAYANVKTHLGPSIMLTEPLVLPASQLAV